MSTDYWCDLYTPITKVGKTNGGMLYAKLATLVAAFGYICFWIAIPIDYVRNTWQRIATQISGVISITLAAFLFTGFHDKVILIGSTLGVVACGLLLNSLFRMNEKKLFILGCVSVFLTFACNVLVFVDDRYIILPVLQKVAFLITFCWTLLLAFQATKNSRVKNQKPTQPHNL